MARTYCKRGGGGRREGGAQPIYNLEDIVFCCLFTEFIGREKSLLNDIYFGGESSNNTDLCCWDKVLQEVRIECRVPHSSTLRGF